jgi:hypothetical protein
VSGWLHDVNVLLGCGWKSHADNSALLGWLFQARDWATCPLTESGFMRISMGYLLRPKAVHPEPQAA